jgi:hypothetical protein
MHIELLVEEPSAQEVVRALADRALGDRHTYEIRTFQGKHDLLAKLPQRLAAYRHWLIDGCVVVLVDRDSDDCNSLKARIEEMAQAAGLATPSHSPSGRYNAVMRIAIEELEAWYLGDVPALRSAFPRLGDLSRRERSRDPDAVAGGTWERLEAELQRVGYYRGGLAKIDLARRLAPLLDPERNRSHSFQVFWRTLCELSSRTA